MHYALLETGTRKIRFQIACQTRQKSVRGKCVMGIISMTHLLEIGAKNRYQKTDTGF